MHTTQAVHKMNIVHANHKDATSRPGGVSLRGSGRTPRRPQSHAHDVERHRGIDGEIGVRGRDAGLDQVDAQHGDHGAVIGAQRDLRYAHDHAVRLTHLEQFRTQLGIGGEATADDQGAGTVLLASGDGLPRQHGGHGIGQRGADVVDGLSLIHI